MESGKLQFDWEQSSEAIALIGLDGKGEESFSLLRHLVSEASARAERQKSAISLGN